MTLKHKNLKLSILDIGTVLQGQDANQTLKNALERVQLVDELGFTRYWFAEHHNTLNQVSTSPDLMVAYAAAHTKDIRVGSGGIMMPNHSPLKVVENFSLLEAMYTSRIDLGIGRATGTDPLTAYALRRSQEAVRSYNFPEQFQELLAFFQKNFPADHPFSNITPIVGDSLIPDIYMLGSTTGGVEFAINEGLGFNFSYSNSPQLAIPVLRDYRNRFKPSPLGTEPKAILTVTLITAETEEEAQYLAGPIELYNARIRTGNMYLPFPTLKEASEHVYSDDEEYARKLNKSNLIVGSIATISEKLRVLTEEAQVDEVMIMEAYSNTAASHQAYRLLAKEFNLKG
ncbi:LLM class flavin-dependent oxidoreductase [Paenibacillus amylolyticus]|uniref:LLM class flavin-dependent oxidoreductase n=1 Tax=Paenibacillus amylolyticus TaxID=1451 RepID=UPI003D96E00B